MKKQCPECFLHYNNFKTGFTFYDIYYIIYHRKFKRRSGVLGYWHEMKIKMWNQHIENCGVKKNEENNICFNDNFDFKEY